MAIKQRVTVPIKPASDAIFDQGITEAGQEEARRDIRENPMGTVLADEMARMVRDVKNERVYGPHDEEE